MDGLTSTLTLEERKAFHTIDRRLYVLLASYVSDNAAMCLQILGLWLWLERGGCRNVVKKILSCPINTINALVDEAVACIKLIYKQSDISGEETVFPLTNRTLEIDLSVQFLCVNRDTMSVGIRKVIGEIMPALSDLYQHALSGRVQSQTDNIAPVNAASSSSVNAMGNLSSPTNPLQHSERNTMSSPANPLQPSEHNTMSSPANPLRPSERNTMSSPANPLRHSQRNRISSPIAAGSSQEQTRTLSTPGNSSVNNLCRQTQAASVLRAEQVRNLPSHDYSLVNRRADQVRNFPSHDYSLGNRRAEQVRNLPSHDYSLVNRRFRQAPVMSPLRQVANQVGVSTYPDNSLLDFWRQVAHLQETPEASEVPESERTMFLTFSKGYPVSEEEVRWHLTSIMGNCIEEIYMQEVPPGEQSLFATVVFLSVVFMDVILDGCHKVKHTINGKHVWMRKYVGRNPRMWRN